MRGVGSSRNPSTNNHSVKVGLRPFRLLRSAVMLGFPLLRPLSRLLESREYLDDFNLSFTKVAMVAATW